MKLFSWTKAKGPEYRVCEKCKNCYVPPVGTLFPEYCSACREPLINKHYRIEAAKNWAVRNLDKVEGMMKDEQKAEEDRFRNSHFSAAQQSQAAYKQSVTGLRNYLAEEMDKVLGR